MYKKHYPPSLVDEVWRLEKISKEGAFHRRLKKERVNTVKDFLTLFYLEPARLRKVRSYCICLHFRRTYKSCKTLFEFSRKYRCKMIAFALKLYFLSWALYLRMSRIYSLCPTLCVVQFMRVNSNRLQFNLHIN